MTTQAASQHARVYVTIPTHTPRHLATCLSSLAWQTQSPDGVVVSCDSDDPAIARVLDEIWPRICQAWRETRRDTQRPPASLLHTFRPHQGEARLNQVRNNALRVLDAAHRLAPRDLIVMIDGDMVLASDAIEKYRLHAARGADVVIPFRVNLDEGRTKLLDAEEILTAARNGTEPAVLKHTHAHFAKWLEHRHERYEMQVRLRESWSSWRLDRLIKSHKPKVLGGHHAVSVQALRAVNGYDEEYVGYGYDDDDLSRRLIQLTPRPVTAIAVSTIQAYHLWHPSRAPARPTDTPGYQRFSMPDLPVSAVFGWSSPRPQPEPRTRAVAVAEANPPLIQSNPESLSSRRPGERAGVPSHP